MHNFLVSFKAYCYEFFIIYQTTSIENARQSCSKFNCSHDLNTFMKYLKQSYHSQVSIGLKKHFLYNFLNSNLVKVSRIYHSLMLT